MLSFPCLQDVDEFFQTERDHNLVLTGYTKTAAEVIQIVFPFLLTTCRHTVLSDYGMCDF